MFRETDSAFIEVSHFSHLSKLVMSTSHDSVTSRLKRQKLVPSDAVHKLMAATEDGRITDEVTLRTYVADEFGKVPVTKWARTTWSHLKEIAPCTALVKIGDADSASGELVLLPPPSMLQLTDAMRKLMYENKQLPIVGCPIKSTLTKHTPPEFDRNDWYLTNAADALALVNHERNVFDERLCLVCLATSSGRRYVTWCTRGQMGTLKRDVNAGKVVLNATASTGINRGDMFVDLTVLDDDLGQLRKSDMDDVLFMLERYIGTQGARMPKGLNPTFTPHLTHRSLSELGGDWKVLAAHSAWKAAETLLETSVAKVREVCAEVEGYRKTMVESNGQEMDDALLSAMRHMCQAKVQSAKTHLRHAREQYTDARKKRKQMYDLVLHALAECRLKLEAAPARMVSIRDELDGLMASTTFEDAMCMHEAALDMGEAMRALGLWNGRGRMPTITRDQVRAAWKSAAKDAHPDGKGADFVVPISADTLKTYRDLLMSVCVPEERDPVVVQLGAIQRSVDKIGCI